LTTLRIFDAMPGRDFRDAYIGSYANKIEMHLTPCVPTGPKKCDKSFRYEAENISALN